MPSSEVIEQLGSTPISGAQPAGASARYEPEFEALEAELDKLSSIAGGEVDWSTVIDHACSLLGTKSKDQLVACYLAYALLEQDGPQGLQAGLRVVDGICRNFWDGMFPALPKLHAREQAFGWLTERVQAWMEKHPLDSSAHEAMCGVVELADGLSQFCDERMEAVGGSGLFAFVRRLRDLSAGITPAAEAEPEPEPSATPKPDGRPAPNPTGPQSGSAHRAAPKSASIQPATPLGALDAGSIQQVREEAFRRLRDLAAFFSSAEPHSPVGPMLRRVSRWAEMDYRELYAELLRNAQNGQESLWDTLGVSEDDEPAAPSSGGGDDWGSPAAPAAEDVDLSGRDDDW